jgi:hypothetical protein
MHDIGLWVEELSIPSTNPIHATEAVDGMNGVIHFSTKLNERDITATLQYDAEFGETTLSFNRKIFNYF